MAELQRLSLGGLRAKALTPHPREVDPERRGFHPWFQGPSVVEPVGLAFLHGLRQALAQPHAVAALAEVSKIDRRWRGFAVEGAGMGCAMRDMLTPGSASRWNELNAATSGRHIYLTAVGLGWALARLPEPLWPDLRRVDPLIVPLVLDGYGFHSMFFDTRRVLTEHAVRFPARRWPGSSSHLPGHLMQGVGRAMWFVCGGSADEVADTIEQFPAAVRPSLWAGIGLAATYAGGVRAHELTQLVDRAGNNRAWLRQGSAFAAEARDRSDTTVDQTSSTVRIICAAEPSDVISLVKAAKPDAELAETGSQDLYEQWRQTLASALGPLPAAQFEDTVARHHALT